MTGTLASPLPAMRCSVFREDGSVAPLTDFSKISEVLAQPGTFVWFDTVDPKHEALALLQEEFALHPLAIEDAISAHQRSKVEAYDGFWFIVVHAVAHGERALVTSEIAIFAGARFVVTVRHDPPYPLEEVERRWNVTATALKRDSGALVYTIVDTVVDDYFPVVEAFESRVEVFERQLLAIRPPRVSRLDRVLRDVLRVKQQLQLMRHVVAPVGDLVARIIRSDVQIFGPDETAYYRDLQDHALRLLDRIDSLHEMVTASLSVHWSLEANRQAETTKRLTVIATIFLPLSFITGFFGQNFGFLINGITGKPEFFWLGIGTEVFALILLAAYFALQRRR